ncbi:uncharacterized protein LOC114296617 [Camellia sinensis]|uniref:uncharacterized protein LOC114296617 n=1 Tax=Camellia sinensis TaxID=4442 RepID=UPI001035DAD2|nr:uncharacterized protein LOC114296617 [Camellia sinensis]
MDDVIMLLCCFRSTNVAYNLKSPYAFVNLINFMCDNFDGLTSVNVRLFFNAPGYKKISLQNDIDMQNMVHLASSFRLQLIEVMVESHDDVSVTADDDFVDTIPSLGTRGTKRSVHQISNKPDIDLLPNYCPHDHIEFKYLKNDTVRITAACSLRESKGCTWLVHARVLDANGFFYLRKWNNEHIWGVAVRTVNNCRLGSDLVSDIFAHRILDKPLTRPTDVAFDLKKNYGLEISYRVAWLGVKKARGELFGAQNASFDQLRWYSGAVTKHNPSTYINIDCDEHDNRFEHFFISFKACIDGFKHCRPLLFLDGTFLKGRFKGNLLAATSKDRNRGLFPVAFAIVGAENATNWSWFLQHLRNALGDDRTFTFILDRHVGLMEAMPIIFPNAHHAFCMQHLQRNLTDKLKYMNNFHRIGLITKFNNCAYAPTVTAFEEMVEKFTNSDKKIAIDFFKNLPPQHWANAYFRSVPLHVPLVYEQYKTLTASCYIKLSTLMPLLYYETHCNTEVTGTARCPPMPPNPSTTEFSRHVTSR